MSELEPMGTRLVADPGRIQKLASRIRCGDLSPSRLLEDCLRRIKEVESSVQAWVELHETPAQEQAKRREEEVKKGQIRSRLHGIPVGVKDVIDIKDRPTRGGSPLRDDAPPAALDAPVISKLREAGAVLLGKTHTTEFAYYDPGPTRNPHHLEHTPGGSSSGSGAAVAAGMVPATLGTQTAGSVNRPAAYCGIAGFKPSTLSLSSRGVLPLAPSFDTVGFMGFRVEDVLVVFDVLHPSFLRSPPGNREQKGSDTHNVMLVEDPLLSEASSDVLSSCESTADQLANAGYQVRRKDAPVSFRRVIEDHTTMMEYELARLYRDLLDEPEENVSQRLREDIERGCEITDTSYCESRDFLDSARRRVWSEYASSDLLVFPAAPDSPPGGLDTTGDPRFITPWTVMGGPIVTCPVGLSGSGLPLAVLLMGSPGNDAMVAERVSQLAPIIEVSATGSPQIGFQQPPSSRRED